MGMSDKDFEELALLEEFEAQKTAPQEEEVTPEQTQALAPDAQLSDPLMGTAGGISVPEEYQNPEAAQARTMGAMQAVPFTKDIYTSFQTLAKTGVTDFGENKNKNQMEWEATYVKMEEKYPNHTNVADLTTSVATGSLVPFGTIPMLMYGAFNGASRQATRDPLEMVKGAAIGGGIAAALPLVGKTVSTVAKKSGAGPWAAKQLGIVKNNFIKSDLGGHTTATLGKLNEYIRRSGSKGKDLVHQTEEFVTRINKVKVEGKPLLGKSFPGQTYEETTMLAGSARQEAGDKISSIVTKMDDAGATVVNGKQLEQKLRDKLVKGGSVVTREDKPALAKLNDDISDFFSEQTQIKTPTTLKKPMIGANGLPVEMGGKAVMIETTEDVVSSQFKPIDFTAEKLQKLKMQAADELSSTDWTKMDKALSNRKTFLKKVRDVADESLTAMEQEVSKTNPSLGGLYRKANTRYGDMATVERMTKAASNVDDNPFSKARAKMAVRGMLSALPNTSGANKASAVAINSIFADVASDAKVDPQTVKTLKRIGSYIDRNPDSEIVKRLIVGATTSDRSEDLGELPFKEAISSAGAEIALLEAPIKRNISDIKLKSDRILEAMQYHSPMMAGSFRESLINGDEESMRMMMDQASKMPELKDIFEDGKGIDGRVFDPQDVQQLKGEVDNMDISYIQKLKHHKALDLNGTVPVIQEEPDRFFQYQKRDKSKPNY